MMRSALALMATLATASAFAPVSRPAGASLTSCQALSMDDMAGSVDFRGKEFKFDPLNLSETYEPFLPWFREAELKHGRTAMLAVVGFIATDFVRLPGELYSFESIPKTIDAHDALLTKGPMGQLVLWIGLWDLIVTAPACVAAAKGEREPGGMYCVSHSYCPRTCLAKSIRISHSFSSLLYSYRLFLDQVRSQGRCCHEEEAKLGAHERTIGYDGCGRYCYTECPHRTRIPVRLKSVYSLLYTYY
jgi:hypothetical protein